MIERCFEIFEVEFQVILDVKSQNSINLYKSM